MSRHQRDAVQRIREAFDDDARVVSLGMPSGFGRQRTLARVAVEVFPDHRTVFVVGRPGLIDAAFGNLVETSAGRKVGLLATGADIEVGTLRRAHGLAREGRICPDLVLVDAMDDGLSGLVDEMISFCPDALAVTVVEPPSADVSADPEEFGFPVTVLARRDPAPGPKPS